jgi:hypothetical protein
LSDRELRILADESLPRKLALELAVHAVQMQGRAGLRNGALNSVAVHALERRPPAWLVFAFYLLRVDPGRSLGRNLGPV